MSWFNSSGLSSFTSTIKEMQKKIDKVLDIKEEPQDQIKTATTDLVASAWGSFSGSFFENSPKEKELVITSSTPSMPSDSIVETQPPRSSSRLPVTDDPMSGPEPSVDSGGLLGTNKLDEPDSTTSEWVQWDPPSAEAIAEHSPITTDPSPLPNSLDRLEVWSPVDISDDTEDRLSVSPMFGKEDQPPGSDQASSFFDDISLEFDKDINPQLLPGGSTDDAHSLTDVTKGASDEAKDDNTNPDKSPSGDLPSSGSIELISSEYVEQSSSIELISSCPSSVPISPEEVVSAPSLVAISSAEVVAPSSVTISPEIVAPLSATISPEVVAPSSVTISSAEVMAAPLSATISPEVVAPLLATISPEEVLVVVDSNNRADQQISEKPSAITRQPTSSVSDWSRCGDEDAFSGQDSSSAYASFAEDTSACESIHSASTSSTHTILDAFPSLHLDLSEGLIDTFESEICEVDETKEDDVKLEKTDSDHTPDAELTIDSEEAKRAYMKKAEAEIAAIIYSSDSQGASSSPERESPPTDSYNFFITKSESCKTQSEYTSGHSSPCETEAETTTSSDIEIISSPSLDGSNGAYRGVAMPTLPGVAAKVLLSAQRGIRSFMPERADPASIANEESVPSSLTTSFTSISESSGESPHAPGTERFGTQMGTVNQSLLEFKSHRRNISSVSEYSESSSEIVGHDVEKLIKKVAHLNDIIDVREAKVLELSHTNSKLADINTKLKSRVAEADKFRSGNDSTEAIREECTQRLAIMERKFQKNLKDNESLGKIVEEYRAQAAEQRCANQLAKQLDEKEITIHELRAEGEKLSKQQLNYSNIVKKLRAKEKETESLLSDQKSKLERQSADLERLQKQLGAKEEIERKQIDAIRQLTVANQKQDVDLKDAIADRDESEGKFRSLKDALDSAYKEISELQHTISTNDADAQQDALRSEIDARQTMESALNDLKKQTHQDQQSFVAQIYELQNSVRLSDSQANSKERQLKNDISDLQERLAASEIRNKDMTDDVTAATRPLLRTIESLQGSHRTKQETWEAFEESLEERIRHAELNAATSLAKEKAMKEEHSDAISELTNFQAMVTELETAKKSSEADVEIWKKKFVAADETRIIESKQWEALRLSFTKELQTGRREIDAMRSQLNIETAHVFAEKRKTASLQDQLKERDRSIVSMQTPVPSSKASAESSPTPSVSDSVTSSQHWMADVFDSTLPARGISLYDSLRGNNAMTVDIMTSTLHQREGELRHVQCALSRSEAQKNSLAKEMTAMLQKLDDLSVNAEEKKRLKTSYHELNVKHNALLQLYGEKIEEVDELRLDLADVKEMYKTQIDELLQKL